MKRYHDHPLVAAIDRAIDLTRALDKAEMRIRRINATLDRFDRLAGIAQPRGKENL